MGILNRIRFLMSPRQTFNTGRLWDNVNTPGGTSAPITRGSALLPLVQTKGPHINVGGLHTPNPEFYLRGAGYIDPLRTHAQAQTLLPVIAVRNPSTGIGTNETYINTRGAVANPTVIPRANPLKVNSPSRTRIRELEYDGGNFGVIKTPQAYTASQRYFDQKQLIPDFQVASHPAHQVYTKQSQLKRGWFQEFVPEPGMHKPIVYGKAPPYMLSTPLVSYTKTGNGTVVVGHPKPIVGSFEGERGPIKQNIKAPKRVRSGG